ncbi:MAG: glucose-1-phosphate cytidylyltransferase [Candidatus Omnitrophica bacterium]|nr:glucose-1-phosphate cytidylyltransferase [Candidatus Omnitrophota bacterium]
MKVVILAGGQGTRLQEETVVKPKPMVEVGEKPILWHIMKIYAASGFNEFVVALGYKGEWIKKYFLNYHQLDHDFSIHTKNGHIDMHDGDYEDWIVHLVDTGYKTQTGGRLKRLKKIIGGETFMMTYGDGVADIDLKELLSFHRHNGKLATVTAVRPEARFGEVIFNGNIVERFVEKPQLGEGWISGGFFVLEPQVLDYIDGDDTIFERKSMERLVSDGQLAAFQHNNFWHSMDTMRDAKFLNDIWAKNEAPWKVWK